MYTWAWQARLAPAVTTIATLPLTMASVSSSNIDMVCRVLENEMGMVPGTQRYPTAVPGTEFIAKKGCMIP